MGVAAVSAPVDGVVAVLLRNGAHRPMRVDLVTAVATRADGGRATRAKSVVAYPQVVSPGELALASVKFRSDEAPTDAEIHVKVRSTPVSAAKARRVLSVRDPMLSPPQTGPVAQTLQASLTNGTSAWKARRPRAAVMCFGEASTPTTFSTARPSVRRLRPGASTPVTISLPSLCPTYLVAARAT
jgi:hypothetical protein